MLCPDIAVKITEHAAKRQESNHQKINKNDINLPEEKNESKKRKFNKNEKVGASHTENKNENEKKNENDNENDGNLTEKLKRTNNFLPLINRQILYDATAGEFHNFNLPPLNPLCAVCGLQSTIFNMEDSGRDLELHLLRIAQVTRHVIIILSFYSFVLYSTIFS